MNKTELATLAKRKIDARRLKALALCDQTLAELRAHEDYRDCERNLREAQVRYVFERQDSAKADVTKYAALQKKLLAKYKLTEADLLPKFHCKKCEDTGYYNGKYCACMQEEITKLLIGESNVQNVSYTFTNSTETDKHNLAVYKKAKEVCLNGGEMRNILLTGGTGCGKTYLLSACANLCVAAGKSVLFVTAYNLGAKFLECHLGDLAEKQAILSNLTDVDVLVIDDLGTERIFKDLGGYLFDVINERMASGKQTFVSTNLGIKDLYERYDERLLSRLVDQNTTFVAELRGADKRTGIKTN